MRVLLIAVGSRGDAEPFCSLAATLAAADQIDAVDLFLQTDLEYLVPKGYSKIHYHALPFTMMDFYKYAGGERKPPQAGADHPNPRVKFLGMVTDMMGELVLPCYSSVMETAQGKDNDENKPIDAIVASSLARQLAMEIALQMEKKIPVYLIQLQSLVPTKDYPHYSQTNACVEALTHETTSKGANTPAENLETFLSLERFQYEFLKGYTDSKLAQLDNYDATRASLAFETQLLALTGHPTPVMDLWMVNAVSTHIIPPTSDAGPRVLNIGGLADNYIPKAFEPPSDLMSFLDKLEAPPICFGYGSMPFGQAEILVDAAYEAKRPSILVGSAMMNVLEKKVTKDTDSDVVKAKWIKENICCVSGIPYPWVLPRCAMMFSHGGAGVLHATLRAGIPAVIAPFLGDQFFFAPFVEAKGWGVKASDNMASLTKEDVLRSIEKADGCKDACRQLGEAMATGEPAGSQSGKYGPELLATAIIQHVSSS